MLFLLNLSDINFNKLNKKEVINWKSTNEAIIVPLEDFISYREVN